MRDWPLNRTGLPLATEDGYGSVITERGEKMVLVKGKEAIEEREANGTEMMAKDETVMDAVATDGGYHPRNIAMERNLAMTKLVFCIGNSR